jgi:transposase
MTRLYARAPKGVRAYGSVPRNRGKNTTLIASMTLEGAMGEAMAVEGSTKAFVFEAYVEYFLAPTLKEGQIVVMDNLGAHKTDKVKELIEERGCKLWFLPAYSPDLNPIEEAFSKVKAHLRKSAARTRGALLEAMGEALSSITPRDAAGWFAHCGYELEGQSS